jgi:hypothetical protein
MQLRQLPPVIALTVLLCAPAVGAQVARSSPTQRSVAGSVPMTTQTLGDTGLVRLLNSVEVLGDMMLGVPLRRIRVIGTWGARAAPGSDALWTQVYVTANEDGDELRAFAVGQLLDPKVDRLRTERGQPVVSLSYGLPRERKQVRTVVTMKGLSIERTK